MRLKFAQKLKTSKEQLKLGFRRKFIEKTQYTREYMTSLHVAFHFRTQVFLQLETLSEQRRKSKLCQYLRSYKLT